MKKLYGGTLSYTYDRILSVCRKMCPIQLLHFNLREQHNPYHLKLTMNHDSQYILASSVLQPIQQVHGCMDVQSLYQPHLGLYSLECEMLKCTLNPVCLLWQLECLKRILTWSEGDRSIVFWHCYLFIASQIACYELCAFWHFWQNLLYI